MNITNEQKIKYLTRRTEDVLLIEASLENKDYESITMIGHRLKGSGETFEFKEISQIGESLENSALEKNNAIILIELERLRQSIIQNSQAIRN